MWHRPASAIGARRRLALALLAAALAGCATPPPAPEPVPAPPPPPEPPPAMTCPTCDEQNREVTRLRQDLANRDAELRDLRLREREQTKALQASARQLTRAKAKLRRQASQADAASTIAEVEVALESLRSAPGAPIRAIAVPRAILESAAVPFAHGDYGVAMDRAAQAEQLIAMLADPAARNHAARTAAEVPFDVAVSLRVARDGNLRRQPRGNSPVQHVLLQGSTVVAHAYKGNWLRVETASGRWDGST